MPLTASRQRPSSSSPRVTTAVPVARSIVQRCGIPALIKLEANRDDWARRLEPPDSASKRQIADPVGLHPCPFLLVLDLVEKIRGPADMLVLYE